jgi:hypothetical protein
MSETAPGSDDVPPLGYLVATLSGDSADVASLSRVLTGALADALPAGMVEIEYDRSMSDRLHGRTGEPVSVTVTVGDNVLTMKQNGRGRPEPIVAHVVRGVVLTRKPVSVTEWITLLADGIRTLAADDATARAALQRLLLG